MELIDPRVVLVNLAERIKYLENGSERKDGRMSIAEIAMCEEVKRCIEVINNAPIIPAVRVARCGEKDG